MDWKKVLAGFKLADIEIKPSGDQVGLLNVKYQNNTYNFHFHNKEAVEAFMTTPKTKELENSVKEEVRKRLEEMKPVFEALPDSTATQVFVATTVVSGLLSTTTTTEP
jgi:hypothetical protein